MQARYQLRHSPIHFVYDLLVTTLVAYRLLGRDPASRFRLLSEHRSGCLGGSNTRGCFFTSPRPPCKRATNCAIARWRITQNWRYFVSRVPATLSTYFVGTSPKLASRSTKSHPVLSYSRDHSLAEGLIFFKKSGILPKHRAMAQFPPEADQPSAEVARVVR